MRERGLHFLPRISSMRPPMSIVKSVGSGLAFMCSKTSAGDEWCGDPLVCACCWGVPGVFTISRSLWTADPILLLSLPNLFLMPFMIESLRDLICSMSAASRHDTQCMPMPGGQRFRASAHTPAAESRMDMLAQKLLPTHLPVFHKSTSQTHTVRTFLSHPFVSVASMTISKISTNITTIMFAIAPHTPTKKKGNTERVFRYCCATIFSSSYCLRIFWAVGCG